MRCAWTKFIRQGGKARAAGQAGQWHRGVGLSMAEPLGWYGRGEGVESRPWRVAASRHGHFVCAGKSHRWCRRVGAWSCCDSRCLGARLWAKATRGGGGGPAWAEWRSEGVGMPSPWGWSADVSRPSRQRVAHTEYKGSTIAGSVLTLQAGRTSEEGPANRWRAAGGAIHAHAMRDLSMSPVLC